MCDTGSVGLGAHCEHVQLVEFSNLLEEGTSVGPQSAVVGHGMARKIETIYILEELRKEGGRRREGGGGREREGERGRRERKEEEEGKGRRSRSREEEEEREG